MYGGQNRIGCGMVRLYGQSRVWDVIDGLQRLSTIFQFAGLLRDEDREIREPLTLQRTDYLPSLEGMKWDDPEDENLSFSQSQRLYVKRAKIDASIILRESDERTKYELFQRLNTGGSPLTSQEVRNCILVMVNRDMYAWMRHLADIDAFKQCVALTDRALNEQYDLELVLRFIIFRTVGVDAIKNIGDLDDFLRVKMVEYAQLDFDRIGEENAFRHTFSLLTNTVGSDCFHKYDERRQKFIGGFLVSAFEAVALGVGYNYVKWNSNNQGLILDKIKSVWSNNDFINNSGSGVRASTRVPRVIPLGRTLFEP